MNNPEIQMTQEEAKDITLAIIDEVGRSIEPMTLQELSDRLKKPIIKVEKCADGLLEAGRIQYKPAGDGIWVFTHKISG